MKFSIKDFFCKYDQICRKLRIWSHLLKKSLIKNFIFLWSDRVLSTPLKFMFQLAITNKFYWQFLQFTYSCDVSLFILNLSLRVFNSQNRVFTITSIASDFWERDMQNYLLNSNHCLQWEFLFDTMCWLGSLVEVHIQLIPILVL